jgi:hypothetical protein
MCVCVCDVTCDAPAEARHLLPLSFRPALGSQAPPETRALALAYQEGTEAEANCKGSYQEGAERTDLRI